MKNQNKRMDPLIIVLSAVAVVLAAVLVVLLLTDPKTGDGARETQPDAAGTSAPTEAIHATDPTDQMPELTEPAGTTDATADSTLPTEEAPSAPPSQKETEPEGTKTPEGTKDPEKTTEPTQGNTEPVMNGSTVNTPYCSLEIPEEWAGRIFVEIKEEEWNTEVLFYGEVRGEKILLYTMHFGGAAGDPVGVLECDAGVMMDVTVEIPDITVSENWTAEERDTVYALQETVNYVLTELGKNQAFTALDA